MGASAALVAQELDRSEAAVAVVLERPVAEELATVDDAGVYPPITPAAPKSAPSPTPSSPPPPAVVQRRRRRENLPKAVQSVNA
ncbi:hypothetical protein [Paludisphaera soli]|uniref:hypothetical protein n=1 Tax=Paludisphaera soli TaxID=2712865 RepID=UPI0013EA77CE|nr:hypothetical protein [Paludisphaera soli]